MCSSAPRGTLQVVKRRSEPPSPRVTQTLGAQLWLAHAVRRKMPAKRCPAAPAASAASAASALDDEPAEVVDDEIEIESDIEVIYSEDDAW